MAKFRKRLSHKQFFTLCEYMRGAKETIEQENMGLLETAVHCSTNLEFDVATTSITEAVEVLGDNGPTLSMGRNADTTNASTIRSLQHYARLNRTAIRELRDAIGELDPDVKDRINEIFNCRKNDMLRGGAPHPHDA